MGCGSGVRTGRCEAAGADRWDPHPVGGHRRSRGIGGALPGRVSLVWNVTIPLGSGHELVAGGLTVREADPPAGEGWPKKRTPAAERQGEGREVRPVLHRSPVELAG
jgi:hypothetical protein